MSALAIATLIQRIRAVEEERDALRAAAEKAREEMCHMTGWSDRTPAILRALDEALGARPG